MKKVLLFGESIDVEEISLDFPHYSLVDSLIFSTTDKFSSYAPLSSEEKREMVNLREKAMKEWTSLLQEDAVRIFIH